MKKIFLFLCVLFCLTTTTMVSAVDCVFSGGDIKNEFKNCNPSIGVISKAQPNLNAQESGSDFRKVNTTMIKRTQIITSILAIAFIIWVGLTLVLPVSAEAKESAKSKVFSVMLGFLIMLAATIIVNGVINIVYEVLK